MYPVYLRMLICIIKVSLRFVRAEEQDISGCTRWDELPEAAKNYVQFLEKQLDHEIQFVSTGAEREKFVLKGAWL